MENQPLLQTPATTSSSPSTSSIIVRLISIAFVATLALWANYEASKGFQITIINDAGGSPAGRRFHLMFDSNDGATRILLNTSQFVENILYPDVHWPRKPIDHVKLRLASQNFTGEKVLVEVHGEREFSIHVSPQAMLEQDVKTAMVSLAQRGVARVWLSNGQNGAPPSLVDGMVQYISMLAGFGPLIDPHSDVSSESDGRCWEDKNPLVVARFLQYCENQNHGFLARLNKVMQGEWHVGMVDDALGSSAKRACASYHSLKVQHANRTNSTSQSNHFISLGAVLSNKV